MDLMSITSAVSRSKAASKPASKPGSAMSRPISVARSIEMAVNSLKNDPLAADIQTTEFTSSLPE